jgi:hypothetical protein
LSCSQQDKHQLATADISDAVLQLAICSNSIIAVLGHVQRPLVTSHSTKHWEQLQVKEIGVLFKPPSSIVDIKHKVTGFASYFTFSYLVDAISYSVRSKTQILHPQMEFQRAKENEQASLLPSLPA